MVHDLDIAIMGQPPPDVAVEKRLLGEHPHAIVAAAIIGWSRTQVLPWSI